MTDPNTLRERLLRDRFEDWAMAQGLRHGRRSPNQYEHEDTQLAWEAFRAAAQILATPQPAPVVPDGWRAAVLNELIVAHIYRKEHDDNPVKAVQDAISWNCQVALDPSVSSDAQALIDRSKAFAAHPASDTGSEALRMAVQQKLTAQRDCAALSKRLAQLEDQAEKARAVIADMAEAADWDSDAEQHCARRVQEWRDELAAIYKDPSHD